MFQGELDCPKPSHGNTHDCAVRTACLYRKPRFNIGDNIVHNVILITILGAIGCIRVVGGAALWHDQRQPFLGKPCDVRIVGPIVKISSSAVEQVNSSELWPAVTLAGNITRYCMSRFSAMLWNVMSRIVTFGVRRGASVNGASLFWLQLVSNNKRRQKMVGRGQKSLRLFPEQLIIVERFCYSAGEIMLKGIEQERQQ